MIELRLTEEQTNLIKHRPDRVRVCDPNGRLLATLNPELTPEYVAELKRRAREGPFYTGDQLSRRLDALQTERDRVGHIDEQRMNEILREMDETDPPEKPPMIVSKPNA